MDILFFTDIVRHLSIKFLNSGEIGSFIKGGGSTTFYLSYYWLLIPDNGALPHINSYMRAPNAQISVLGPYSLFIIAYGVIYIGLPKLISLNCSLDLIANPKSAILHVPDSSTKILAILKSRWIILF